MATCRHKAAVVVPTTPSGGPVVLPSGTVLALIVADTIDSGVPVIDRAYAAVISRDVKQGAPQAILPSGSPATLVLMSKNENSQPSWELGISSIMVNGDSFLAKGEGKHGAPLGAFLGGIPGPDYSDSAKRRIAALKGLVVSGAVMHITPGSLLTFRLQEEIALTGSRH